MTATLSNSNSLLRVNYGSIFAEENMRFSFQGYTYSVDKRINLVASKLFSHICSPSCQIDPLLRRKDLNHILSFFTREPLSVELDNWTLHRIRLVALKYRLDLLFRYLDEALQGPKTAFYPDLNEERLPLIDRLELAAMRQNFSNFIELWNQISYENREIYKKDIYRAITFFQISFLDHMLDTYKNSEISEIEELVYEYIKTFAKDQKRIKAFLRRIKGDTLKVMCIKQLSKVESQMRWALTVSDSSQQQELVRYILTTMPFIEIQFEKIKYWLSDINRKECWIDFEQCLRQEFLLEQAESISDYLETIENKKSVGDLEQISDQQELERIQADIALRQTPITSSYVFVSDYIKKHLNHSSQPLIHGLYKEFKYAFQEGVLTKELVYHAMETYIQEYLNAFFRSNKSSAPVSQKADILNKKIELLLDFNFPIQEIAKILGITSDKASFLIRLNISLYRHVAH